MSFLRHHATSNVTFQELHEPTLRPADREWRASLVQELELHRLRVAFKFVTLTSHVADEKFIASLASVGMKGCGVGIETLSADGRPLERKTREHHVIKASAVAARQGVALTAYVQVGLPGQRRADVIYTIERLRDLGYRLRPTGHTPFDWLADLSVEKLDALDLYHWDRKSYWDPVWLDRVASPLASVAAPDLAITGGALSQEVA